MIRRNPKTMTLKKRTYSDKMLSVIFILAWPTMLEEFMQTAVQYIDTAMVGSLGTKATASVGATTTVNWLVLSTVSAIGVGFLSYIAKSFGAGKTDQARRASAQAVMTVVIVGVSITVLTLSLSGLIPVWMQVDADIREQASRYFFILYSPMLFRCANIIFGTVLRASRDTRTPMRVAIYVNVINIILNVLLIYETRDINIAGVSLILPGAGMGVEGAALASAIAYTYGGVAMTYKLWKHPLISPSGQRFSPDMTVLKPCLRVAVPNMFQRFATSLGYVAFASMINSLGQLSTAAHTIANTVESAFYIPGWGMQTAAATIAGNAYGARDEKKLTQLKRTIVPLEIGLMLVSGTVLFIWAPALMGIFSKDADVIELGTIVLRMVAVSEPFYGVPIVMEGIMQGLGRTVKPFVFNVIGMWGVRIVGTYICINLLGLGLIAAWGCMIGHNMLLFIMYVTQKVEMSGK